jgi:hypothetical protein
LADFCVSVIAGFLLRVLMGTTLMLREAPRRRLLRN